MSTGTSEGISGGEGVPGGGLRSGEGRAEEPWILATLDELREGTTRVLDLRPTPAFFGGHLPGSLHLPPWIGTLDVLATRDPWRFPGLPEAGNLRAELEQVWMEAGRWVVIHPLFPPGPGILAAWCRAGHALATIGEVTAAEMVDLERVESVRRVNAAAPPGFDTHSGSPKAVVEGATLPLRALVASLLKRRGFPEVLVLVD